MMLCVVFVIILVFFHFISSFVWELFFVVSSAYDFVVLFFESFLLCARVCEVTGVVHFHFSKNNWANVLPFFSPSRSNAEIECLPER